MKLLQLMLLSPCPLCLRGEFCLRCPSPRRRCLSAIMPRGGQRGTEVVLTFGGARLADAKEILCYSPGFQVTKLDVKDNQVKATVKIAADCRLGEHAFRVRTATGVSELRTFWVGALPVVDEKEPNNEFAKPQKIPLNCTVHGVVDKRGRRLLRRRGQEGPAAQRRDRRHPRRHRHGVGNLFDPYIAILDTKRFELAAVRRHAAPRAGRLPVDRRSGRRHVRRPGARERLRGQRRLPLSAARRHLPAADRPSFPPAASPARRSKSRFLGDPAGEIKQKIKLPAEPEHELRPVRRGRRRHRPSGMPFRLSDLPNVIEVEPNDAVATATKGAGAGRLQRRHRQAGRHRLLPLHGQEGADLRRPLLRPPARLAARLGDVRLQRPGRRPSSATTTCRARRTAISASASRPTANTCSASPITWGRAGRPTSTASRSRRSSRDVEVAVPQFAQYPQDRQWIVVPRGNRYATLLTTSRADWGGDLALDAAGLPAGREDDGRPGAELRDVDAGRLRGRRGRAAGRHARRDSRQAGRSEVAAVQEPLLAAVRPGLRRPGR